MTRTPAAARSSITEPEADAQGSGFATVFSFLRDQLLEGAICNGDRLLPERELALQLGVSRPIVSEALRSLSMMGVVEIRERVGTVVCQPDISVLGEVFAFSLARCPTPSTTSCRPGSRSRSHRDRRRAVGGQGGTIKRTVEDHRHLLQAVITGDAADLALRRHFHIGYELRRKKALATAEDCGCPGRQNTQEQRSNFMTRRAGTGRGAFYRHLHHGP